MNLDAAISRRHRAYLTACHALCIARQQSRHQSLVQVTPLASRGKARTRL